MKFSVITSVYKNDKPEFVRIALDSMLIYQSVKPSEIILVQDGPIPDDLALLLSEYEVKYSEVLHVIHLDQNKGLGNALMQGVEIASNEYIARMDSDDICLADRFEKQLSFLEANSEVDIVGGQMTEFIDSPEKIVGKREVPLTNEAIYNFMRSRCALNHVTVMFKKTSVLNAGNYKDWFWNEDYYLWIRMMLNKCVFANIPDVIVNVRSGVDQYSRRGGRKYFESEKDIKKFMLDNKIINYFEYIFYISERFIFQVLISNKLRGWIYREFARK